MRVFLAGASGVIGRRLGPLLVGAGHTVAGLTRSQPDAVAALGAEPVVADALDPDALAAALTAFRPDVVLGQLTNLPDAHEELGGASEANFRVRTEGTRNLLAAAGSVKTVAQSAAFAARVEELERLVRDADGVILRYGYWYGPGTWYEDSVAPAPRIHIDEAARRTLEALDAPRGSVITLVERD
jgi:nucleoside-diphosphate-sugar epimerase